MKQEWNPPPHGREGGARTQGPGFNPSKQITLAPPPPKKSSHKEKPIPRGTLPSTPGEVTPTLHKLVPRGEAGTLPSSPLRPKTPWRPGHREEATWEHSLAVS